MPLSYLYIISIYSISFQKPLQKVRGSSAQALKLHFPWRRQVHGLIESLEISRGHVSCRHVGGDQQLVHVRLLTCEDEEM